MKNTENKIEFLNKLSNILAGKISPVNTINSINKLFKSCLLVSDVEFIMWDNQNMLLKDFTRASKFSHEYAQEREINFKYGSLSISNGTTFFFNDTEFSCSFSENEEYLIDELISEENLIIFPLVANQEVFGLMKIKCGKIEFTKEFFALLNVASKFISGAMINYNLNEQMEISLNFYKAMKDIAKIIESQYELSYIIPLIGEMIDRFMNSHLIYIFINQDEKYELVWPGACKDKKIYNLLNKINKETQYILSDNAGIGVFPLISDDKILGAVAAYSNIDKLSKQDIDYLQQLTKQSGLTIQRANVYAEILKYATMDALTGLNNRRQMEIRLNQEVANAKRNKKPLCCMMIDVDYFKKVNDTYGHAAGDCILKSVSDIIKNEIREYDIACRYGGEEFLVILPQTNKKEAILVAQRLRKVIENSKTDVKQAGVKGVEALNVTVSIGVCSFASSMTGESFVQKTDKALYEAKTTGRNRVIYI